MTTASTTASITARASEPTLLLAADTPAELARLLDRPDAVLCRGTAVPSAGRCRLGIVGPTAKNLALARRVVAKGRPWRGRNDVWFSPEPLLAAGTGIAFLFPGLEGEFAPRVDDLAGAMGVAVPAPDVTSIGSHAAGALRVGRLLNDALRRMGIAPDFVAGHSVGEWNAMSAGGMFAAAELDAMIARCDLDAMAVPDVDFGIAGCPVERLAPVLAAHPTVVVSHENSTNQSVVCGPPAAVTEVLDTLRADGVICQVLPFRSGFHTPMLRPHLSFFEDGLTSLPLRRPDVPVWSSTTSAPFPAADGAVRELCVRHLLEPVRFRGTVAGLYRAGARVFVQVGPGQLGSLVSDTLRGHDHLTIAANSSHRSGLAQLQRVATAIWAEGGRPRFVEETAFADAVPAAAAAVVPARRHQPSTSQPAAAELHALLGELTDLAELAGSLLGGAVPAAAPAETISAPRRDVLHVSADSMPYLLDHCFVPQRGGWPDIADRRPVVPATTVVAHLLDAARDRTGSEPIGIDYVHLKQWLVATPAVDVPVETGPAGPGRLRVSLGAYAEAEVVFDEARPHAPAPWPPAPDERAPVLRAHELYDQRWLFHGEQFRVLERTVAVGATTARADLRVTDVPGALLDGVGHVLAQWLVEQKDATWLAFPVRISRLRFHAPLPPTGSLVQCMIRILASNDVLEAEAQVTYGGRVVISIDDWADRFFDCEREVNEVYRFPESGLLAEQQPDGRWSVRERWRDLASRELWLHRYLTGAEVADYRRCPPREQRGWLLTRIVVKDAVRAAMWRAGAGPIFPAELTVHSARSGWCTVTGTHGLPVPDVACAVVGTSVSATAQLHDGAAAFATTESETLELTP